MKTFQYINTFQDKNKPHLEEETQKQKVTFSYCKKIEDIYQNTTPFFHCHEFITDILLMEKTKTIFNCYGLNYIPTEEIYNPEKTTFILNLPLKEYTNLKTNLYLIHKLEDYYQIKHTEITELNLDLLNSDSNYYNFKSTNITILLEADSMWMLQTISLSFYTCLIRLLTKNLEPNTKLWTAIKREQQLRFFEDKNLNKLDFDSFYFKLFILHLKELCYTLNIKDTIKDIKDSLLENNYIIHGSIGFVSFYRKFHIQPSYLKTLIQIAGNNKNKEQECPVDVKDAITF